MELRTLSTIPCLIGVIRDSWQHGIRIVHPVADSWDVGGYDEALMTSPPEGRHIIHLALNWAKALQSGLVGSCDEIGKEVGLSGGRVRQIVRLAGLHPKIVENLASLKGVSALRRLSERRLRLLISLSPAEQLSRFEAWIWASQRARI